ncbi:unnamed protein product [Nezara viridula]|uniref:Uncharacterized protein n=1 Tax=Nezara viridula TaxID=85310 RepID=A0A9P0H2B6_NEZVI|nr:unnamed protein product [Nezara viridula]
MILFCGFNGFKQFLSLSNNEKYISENDVIGNFFSCKVDYEPSLVSVSWSNILIWSNKKLILSGFVNGEPGKSESLDIPFKESVIQTSCGKLVSTIVTSSGQVWQYNIDSGIWKNISNLFYAEVLDKDQGKIVKVCNGGTLNVALSDTGVAYCIPNILNYSGKIKDVACGKEHGVLLTEDGSVLTWGGGSRGQLGTGDLESSETLCEVEALSGLRVVVISAGGWHTAVVTEEGDLYTWGWNKQGQLGFPTIDIEKENGVSVLATPRPVDLPENMLVEQVSCGASHTIIKLRDGDILGCGWNKWGQLGLKGVQRCSTMTKLPVTPEASVRQLVCGPWNTVLLCN